MYETKLKERDGIAVYKSWHFSPCKKHCILKLHPYFSF